MLKYGLRIPIFILYFVSAQSFVIIIIVVIILVGNKSGINQALSNVFWRALINFSFKILGVQ